MAAPGPRSRVLSTPAPPPTHIHSEALHPPLPPSAGPYQPSFGPTRPAPPPPLNSPFRSSFGHYAPSHSRTRSTSGPSAFAPPLSSPLASSFSSQSVSTSKSPTHLAFPTSATAPEFSSIEKLGPPPSRRHGRIHSRNLSVFFPKPESLSNTTIAEDESQEVEIPSDPVLYSQIPEHKQELRGFTFGGRQNNANGTNGEGKDSSSPPAETGTRTKRRGHHHKHSMSHQFFSFLEPGSELHTQPTPTPISPWNSISPLPMTPQTSSEGAPSVSTKTDRSLSPPPLPSATPSKVLSYAASTLQFGLGAVLWASGQQRGSLASTAVGYWVVFDAAGIFISCILPILVHRQRPGVAVHPLQSSYGVYGKERVTTVALFAQAVYLLFAAVYVCKEAMEHFLLSAGEGHHHHAGDEDNNAGVDLPILLISLTLSALLVTASLFDHNLTLVDITDLRMDIPRYFKANIPPSVLHVLTNPYTASPFFASIIILCIALFNGPHTRTLELCLAFCIAYITFRLSYRACKVLGTVLLQTAPPRAPGGTGRMDNFLRAMREIERHPQVAHLPPPHIWQLTPAIASSPSPYVLSHQERSSAVIVATLEIHVRNDLADEDVMKLAAWAEERCVKGLSGRSASELGFARSADAWKQLGVEVCVGIVREAS